MSRSLGHSLPAEAFIPQAKVTDFPSASQNNNPNVYPGERPICSYMTDGTNLYAIDVRPAETGLLFTMTTDQGPVDVNQYLADKNVPTLEDRIPVLAFGANMAPGSLSKKFQKDTYKLEGSDQPVDNRPDLSIIPTIYAKLSGYDVVWSGGPGVNGNFAAALYRGDETQATQVEVGLNFLTREQLLMMHATELSYDLSLLTVTVGGKEIQAYYYAGADSIYLQDGTPVAVESVPAVNRVLPVDTTERLVDNVLSDTDLMAEAAQTYPQLANVTTSNEYYDFVRSLKPVDGSQPKLALKNHIHALLAKRGSSKVFENEDARSRMVSWANPSMLATYGQQQHGVAHGTVYRLPSQELTKDGWINDAARRKVLRSMVAHLVRTSDGALAFSDDQKQT